MSVASSPSSCKLCVAGRGGQMSSHTHHHAPYVHQYLNMPSASSRAQQTAETAAAPPTASLSAWSTAVLESIPHARRAGSHAQYAPAGQDHAASSQQPPQQHRSPHSRSPAPTIIVHSPHPITLHPPRSSSPPTRSSAGGSGAPSAGLGAASDAARMSTDYHSLLSRVALQSSELALERAQNEGLQADKQGSAAILKILGQGLQNVWERIEGAAASTPGAPPQTQTQQPQFSPRSAASLYSPTAAQVHPLSSPTSGATAPPSAQTLAFARAQIRSMLEALASGSLGAGEAQALLGLLGSEIEEHLHRASAVAAAREAEALRTRQANEQGALAAVHRLGSLLASKRSQATQRQILHVWHAASLASSCRSKLLGARAASAEILAAQHDRRFKAGVFRTWRTLVARRVRAARIARALQQKRGSDQLRKLYTAWRLKLLSDSRSAVAVLRQKLSHQLSQEHLSDHSRASFVSLVQFYQLRILLAYTRGLKAKAAELARSHARRMLRAWSEAAARKRARTQSLVPLLQRALVRQKARALLVWSQGVQRLRQRRLHCLAYVVEKTEAASQLSQHKRLLRGFLVWLRFAREKERAAAARELAAKKTELEAAMHAREEQLRQEVSAGLAQSRREQAEALDQARAQLTLDFDAQTAEVRADAEARVAAAAEHARGLITAAQSSLEKERDAWAAEKSAMKQSHALALDAAAEQALTSQRSLRAQVEELQLTQKHVVLEMKHQERVYNEYKDQADKAARKDASVSGVLFPHQAAAAAAQAAAAQAAAASGSGPFVGSGPAVVTYPSPFGGVAAGVAHFNSGPAAAAAAPAAPAGDPYLASPLYQQHLKDEVERVHRADLQSLQSAEKKHLVLVTQLRAEVANLTNLYHGARSEAKKARADLAAKVADRAQSSGSALESSMAESYRLREQISQGTHALEIARMEHAATKEKLAEAIDRVKTMEAEAKQMREAFETSTAKASELYRADLASLKSEHAASLERSEASSAEKLSAQAASHAASLADAQSKWEAECTSLLGCIDALKLEASEAAQAATAELDARGASLSRMQEQLREQAARSSQLAREKDDLLDRNRRLAAALVETKTDHVLAAHSGGGGGGAGGGILDQSKDERHFQQLAHAAEIKIKAEAARAGTTHAAAPKQRAHRPQQQQQQATVAASSTAAPAVPRPSSRAQSRERAPSHQAAIPVAPASAASSDSSAGNSELTALLAGGAALPDASGPRLSLTPITHLAFSPPITPPAGSLADEPWPAPSAIDPDDGPADPVADAAEVRESLLHLSSYPAHAGAPTSVGSYLPPHPMTEGEFASRMQNQSWMHSPAPAGMGSPNRSIGSTGATRYPHLSGSAQSALSPTAAGAYPSLHSPYPVNGRSAGTWAAPVVVTTRPVSHAMLAAARSPTSLRSPAGSLLSPMSQGSASRMDVARVFQKGLTQY